MCYVLGQDTISVPVPLSTHEYRAIGADVIVHFVAHQYRAETNRLQRSHEP